MSTIIRERTFVCLMFIVPLEIFFLYEDVTIAGEWLHSLIYAQQSLDFIISGFFLRSIPTMAQEIHSKVIFESVLCYLVLEC